MRVSDLLDNWVRERKPSKQTEHGTRQSVTDLINLYGDVATVTITRDMVMEYRDQAKGCLSPCRRPTVSCPSLPGSKSIR